MQRPTDTVLDRAVASEIALRDGARAVILPTVAEVGGRVRVSAEVIDPRTQTTVYSESADGSGVESSLKSIDTVTAALRGKLGEALESIEATSSPLPQVSTGNLDALRAYALGQRAYAQGQMPEALQFYERATQLDPDFALAWIGQLRAHYADMHAPRAIEPLRRAQALRSHLTPREGLYMDAWASAFDAPAKTKAKWVELAKLYPDYFPAQQNATIWLYGENRFDEALVYIQRLISPQNQLLPQAYDFLGRVRLGKGQYRLAATAFDQALARGYKDSLRRRVDVDAAQRSFATARQMLAKAPSDDRYSYLERISIAIDQGAWDEAMRNADRAQELVARETGFDNRLMLMPAATAAWLSGDRAKAMTAATEAANRALTALELPIDADAEDDAGLALSAALLTLRLNDKALAQRVTTVLAKHAELMESPNLAELGAVVRAETARLSGRPQEAIALLTPLVTGQERYQTRVALLASYAAAGELDAGLNQVAWLQSHRGQAYMEQGCGQCLQALNIADANLAILTSAELASRSGKSVDARQRLSNFDRIWPVEVLPDHLRARRGAVVAASNAGGL